MGKIAYNYCYGSFSLSYKATLRYVELAYPEIDLENLKTLQAGPGEAVFLETLGLQNTNRTDPLLIRVIEELGKEANGNAADLRICELPSGTKYRVDDYDGKEKVMTPDDYTWETVP